MNRDDIIVMAEKSGFQRHEIESKIEEFEYFANLVAASERDVIADMVSNCDPRATPKGIAAAIRARGAP